MKRLLLSLLGAVAVSTAPCIAHQTTVTHTDEDGTTITVEVDDFDIVTDDSETEPRPGIQAPVKVAVPPGNMAATPMRVIINKDGLTIRNSRIVSVFAPAAEAVQFYNISAPMGGVAYEHWVAAARAPGVNMFWGHEWPPSAELERTYERWYRIPFDEVFPTKAVNVVGAVPDDLITIEEFNDLVAEGVLQAPGIDLAYYNPFIVHNEVRIAWTDADQAPFPIDVLVYRLYHDPYTRMTDQGQKWPNNWWTFKWAGVCDLNMDGVINHNDLAVFWQTMPDWNNDGVFDHDDWLAFQAEYKKQRAAWELAYPAPKDPEPEPEPEPELIDINSADSATLQTLPGIGPTLAQRIIAYRTLNGPFATTADIVKVSGIGQTTYDRIKDLIDAVQP